VRELRFSGESGATGPADRVGGASRPRPPTPPYVLSRIRRFLRLIERQVPPRPVRCRAPRAAKATDSTAGWFRLAAELWPTPPYRMWRGLSADPPSDLSVCSLQSKIQPFTAALTAAAATMASADFSGAIPSGYPNGSPMFRTEPEISSGKAGLLLADPSDLPHSFRMTIGHPRPWPGDPSCKGLISASCTSHPRFRRRFSSDPPRGGHPCLAGWFRSLRSMGDFHPLNTSHTEHTRPRACPTIAYWPLESRAKGFRHSSKQMAGSRPPSRCGATETRL